MCIYKEQQKRNKEQKQKQYEEDSKGRLLKIGSKQIRTTMIGALDIIEKNFGFLWNHNGQPQTDEQILFKEKYEYPHSDWNNGKYCI